MLPTDYNINCILFCYDLFVLLSVIHLLCTFCSCHTLVKMETTNRSEIPDCTLQSVQRNQEPAKAPFELHILFLFLVSLFSFLFSVFPFLFSFFSLLFLFSLFFLSETFQTSWSILPEHFISHLQTGHPLADMGIELR